MRFVKALGQVSQEYKELEKVCFLCLRNILGSMVDPWYLNQEVPI